MKQQMIPEALNGIKDEGFRLLKYIRALEMTDIATHPDVYTDLIMEASIRSEKIACAIRRLVYQFTPVKKAELLSRVATDAQKIKIEGNGRGLCITLPALLSKKKHKTEFLSEPLFCALSEYMIETEFHKLCHAVVCFEHVYDRDQADKQYRDYDNLEEKQILDVIAIFALADDNGQVCDVFNTTATGDYNHTRIYVMPPEWFIPWLNSRNVDK